MLQKFVVVHPTGNEFCRQTLRALQERQALSDFYTSIAVNANNPFLKLLPPFLRRNLLKRSYDLDVLEKTTCLPFREIGRQIGHQFNLAHFYNLENAPFSVDKVYSSLSTHVAKKLSLGVSGVYCYEDGALETFQRAKQLGIKCFYDLPIAFHETLRTLILHEIERYPEWRVTLEETYHSNEKKERKNREIELADEIICPSPFVYRSLPDKITHEKKCHIIPFGCDIFDEAPPRRTHHKLRVLFAGSHTQRKGLADLFAAIKLLKSANIEILSVGSLIAPIEFYQNQCPQLQYHPPRPRSEVLKLMRTCDVLVLPSIVEGRALVQLEALSCGLPLIITPNTGGDDLIIEGETGFMVPTGSPEQIADKIDWFAQNKQKLPDMSRASFMHGQSIHWGKYREMMASVLLR
jgi:glycosyltransferase involved in cell wall biosynthesis